jgi:hypothetical protein
VDVKLVAIDSSFNLDTGELTGALVLRLPDGQLARVQASHDVVEHIQGLLVQAPVPPLPYPLPPVPEPGMAYRPVEPQRVPTPDPVSIDLPEPPPVEEEMIRWEVLPASVLSATMREAFEVLGVPPTLTREQLATAMAEVRRIATLSVQEPPDAPVAPKVGEVVWNSVSGGGGKKSQIRFPPKTNYGYPLPQRSMVADPGETQDDGEDGVDQV